MSRRGARNRLASLALVAAALVLVTPGELLAWGPGVHVFLGLETLGSLNLLPSGLAVLLARYPLQFLYGNLAADISMAKKYAPVGRHCHHWHVGREILAGAGRDPALRAAAHGYLSHLAADVLAHNAFVPRMLLLTSSTRGLGHSYWEHRVDAGLGGEQLSLARRIVTEFDHERADALFDAVLSHTLFSFRTNRRIFRGLIRMSDLQRWQDLFDTVVENSRWEITPAERELYLRHTFQLVLEQLREGEAAGACRADPTGERALETARRVRREILRREGIAPASRLAEAADRHFPLPTGPTPLWTDRGGTAGVVAEVRERPELRAATT